MTEPDSIYSSLFFAGRNSLNLQEVADKLCATSAHVKNLIDGGELNAVNTSKDTKNTRANYRVPVESYNEFIVERLVRGAGQSVIFELDEEIQRHIYRLLRLKFDPEVKTS